MGMPLGVKRIQPPVTGFAVLDDGSSLIRSVAGDARGAARVRGEFQGWLHRHFSAGAERLGDVVLAVNEALANAVEFGCPPPMGRGIVAFAAAHDHDTHALNVTVTDGGRWRLAAVTPPPTPGRCPRRGRGIALMRLLTDDVQIAASGRGTQVSLTWTDLHCRQPIPSRSIRSCPHPR